MRLGYLLAGQPKLVGEYRSLVDAWRSRVVPMALGTLADACRAYPEA